MPTTSRSPSRAMRPIRRGHRIPIVTQGADGKTTLIVNTDGEYTYLGRLVVEFDANGDIVVDNLATTPADQRRLCLDGRERRGGLGTTVERPADHRLRRRHQGRQGREPHRGRRRGDHRQGRQRLRLHRRLSGGRARLHPHRRRPISATCRPMPTSMPRKRGAGRRRRLRRLAARTAAASAPRSARFDPIRTGRSTSCRRRPIPTRASRKAACRSSMSRTRCASTTS